jgi:hypothetical protein
MQPHPLPLERMPALANQLRQPLVERIPKRDVSDEASLEEGKGADALCAVDDLVGNDEVPRFDLLPQGAHGGKGNDGADAEAAQRGDVGAGGHFVGGELVVEAVAGEEGDGEALSGRGGRVQEDGDGRGGEAPGRGGVEGGDVLEVREVLEAGAADDGDVDGVCGC